MSSDFPFKVGDCATVVEDHVFRGCSVEIVEINNDNATIKILIAVWPGKPPIPIDLHVDDAREILLTVHK